MPTAWPTDDAFKEIEAPRPGQATHPVAVTVSDGGRMAGKITATLSPDTMQEAGLDIGDRFRVLVHLTGNDAFLRLVKDNDGRVQLSVSPGRRDKASCPSRGVLRLPKIEGANLEPRRAVEVEFRAKAGKAATLELRIPRAVPGAPLPGPQESEPEHPSAAEVLARKIARRMAGEGKSDAVILRSLEEDQNLRRDASWLDRTLEREG